MSTKIPYENYRLTQLYKNQDTGKAAYKLLFVKEIPGGFQIHKAINRGYGEEPIELQFLPKVYKRLSSAIKAMDNYSPEFRPVTNFDRRKLPRT